MKKNNIFRVLMPVVGVSFAILFTIILSGIFVFASGVVMAATGTAVAGDPVTVQAVKAAASDLDSDHVSQQITKMKPSATPLDTIMRHVKAKQINSFKTDFYAVDSRALKDTVKTAFTSSGDGSTTYNLVVNNPGAWNEDDTCWFPTVTSTDSNGLVCFILGKSSTYITIQPLNGAAGSGTTDGELILPNIVVDSVIVRMGNAKHELDAQTDPYAIIPAKDYNYCQLFMAQVEEGVYQRMHDKEVDWGFSDYEAMSIYDMKATMEYSFLFGYRALITDKKSSPKQRYFTGGIVRDITKALTYGTGGSNRTITESDFVTWGKTVFTQNSGSDTRILFMGDAMASYISQIDTVSKQMQQGNVEVKWGIRFNRVETNFGVLLMKHHTSFDIAGWGDNGVVLDVNNIEKHSFLQTKVTKLNLKEAGLKNADANVIAETSTLVLRYPDAHAVIKPKA